MFPNIIGGHCLLPNSKLMLSKFEPEMLKLIIDSNDRMSMEIKDPEILAQIKKVTNRVAGFEKEQDKQVLH